MSDFAVHASDLISHSSSFTLVMLRGPPEVLAFKGVVLLDMTISVPSAAVLASRIVCLVYINVLLLVDSQCKDLCASNVYGFAHIMWATCTSQITSALPQHVHVCIADDKRWACPVHGYPC